MAQECTPDVTSHAITAPGKYFSLTEVVYYQIYIHVCGAAVIQTINHEEVLLLNLSHSSHVDEITLDHNVHIRPTQEKSENPHIMI